MTLFSREPADCPEGQGGPAWKKKKGRWWWSGPQAGRGFKRERGGGGDLGQYSTYFHLALRQETGKKKKKEGEVGRDVQPMCSQRWGGEKRGKEGVLKALRVLPEEFEHEQKKKNRKRRLAAGNRQGHETLFQKKKKKKRRGMFRFFSHPPSRGGKKGGPAVSQ